MQSWYFLGDLVLSFLLAIPLTLIFEIPFGNIDRYFFRNVSLLPLPPRKKGNKKQEVKSEENNNLSKTEERNVTSEANNDNLSKAEEGNINEAFVEDYKS